MRELLLAGRRRVRELQVATDLDDAGIVSEILDLAGEARVRVTQVSRARLEADARTDAPQGVIARADELEPVPLEDLVRRRPKGPAPFLVAVDGITDPRNLGAILRSAECAGVSGVLLPKHRAAHITPTAAKAAAGAIEHLPMALVGGMPTALAQLKGAGVWVVGLDGDADDDLWTAEGIGTEPVCLVLGAEGKGLSRLVRERCDVLVRVPMAGRTESLNVSVAAALACYEVVRRRSASNPT